MPKIFIPNDTGHDFSKAEQFGELVFLSDGPVNKMAVPAIYTSFMRKMGDASVEDFIMTNSLSLLVGIASSIMAARFKRVNYLIWGRNGYMHRRILLPGYNAPALPEPEDD